MLGTLHFLYFPLTTIVFTFHHNFRRVSSSILLSFLRTTAVYDVWNLWRQTQLAFLWHLSGLTGENCHRFKRTRIQKNGQAFQRKIRKGIYTASTRRQCNWNRWKIFVSIYLCDNNTIINLFCIKNVFSVIVKKGIGKFPRIQHNKNIWKIWSLCIYIYIYYIYSYENVV